MPPAASERPIIKYGVPGTCYAEWPATSAAIVQFLHRRKLNSSVRYMNGQVFRIEIDMLSEFHWSWGQIDWVIE